MSGDKQECKEYNALKYKTMILTGNNIEKKIDNETNEDTINNFLINEMKENKKQSWNKLSKTEKIKKLNHYINNNLSEKYDLSEIEKSNTKRFILGLLDRKKLTKNNDIEYDSESGNVINIALLLFNTSNRKFTLNKELNQKKTKTIKKKAKESDS
jgi:hypothetical protein